MLLEVVQKQQELSIVTTDFIREVTASHKLTQDELIKMKKLHEQFEALQEMFGKRLARAPENASLEPFSVIPGGKDDT